MNFCSKTGQLLVPSIINDNLYFIASNGNKYEGNSDDTLISQGSVGNVDYMSKYKNIINSAAYDPTYAKIQEECKKCNRKIQTLLRLGKEKKIVMVCLCGNITII